MGTLEEAIQKASEFIFKNRDTSGLWSDFKTRTHGESIDWTTSYVGLCLLESGIPSSDLELSADSIFKRQNEEHGGWGYNERIVPDADSTAFTILFLSHFGHDLTKAREFLLRHRKPDGSFGTYVPELIRQYHRIPAGMPVDGWCSGNPDVTATASRAMGGDNEAIEYLKRNQTAEGFWRSYWYNSDVYSTAHGIVAIEGHDSGPEIKKARTWLSRQAPSEARFYIALSIRGLTADGNFAGEARYRINLLLDSQQADGSWKSHPILRFPLPSNPEPWRDTGRWRGEAKDQNRIFTTATCMHAISQYESLNDKPTQARI